MTVTHIFKERYISVIEERIVRNGGAVVSVVATICGHISEVLTILKD